jgi:prevent-host-death family protein
MDEMRVTSLELHQKLGQTIDRARLEPVTVTRHDRDHVVILSAEAYASLRQAARKARLTGSLTTKERKLAAAATVPSGIDRKRYLKQLAAAVEAKSA